MLGRLWGQSVHTMILAALLRRAWPLFSLFLAGCAGGPQEESGSQRDSSEATFRIFSFWTEGGEREALNELVSTFETEHPELTIDVFQQDGGLQGFQKMFRLRSEQNTYPNVIQANAGLGVLEWALRGRGDTDSSILLDFGPSLDPTLVRALHPEALRSVSYEEETTDPEHCGKSPPCTVTRRFGMPLNVHRNNLLLYDSRFLREELDVPAPSSWEELIQLCERVRAEFGIAPFAIGGKDKWPLHVLFEGLLLSVAEPGFYDELWRGQLALTAGGVTMKTVEAALDRFLELRACSSRDAGSVRWSDAVERVVQSKERGSASASAAFTATGDWAVGLLQSHGLKLGEDFDLVPFPGTEDVFVMTVDTFAIPLGSSQKAAGLEFIQTIGRAEVQSRFSRVKGSIPARVDATVDPSNAVSIRNYCDLWGGGNAHETAPECHPGAAPKPPVYSIAMLLPNRAVEALDQALFALLQDGEKETVRILLRNYYPLFRRSAADSRL